MRDMSTESHSRVAGGLDVVVVGALVVGAFLVYPMGFILEHPFFVDEAWVAVGTRAPWADLPYVAFPTPIGWAALLRLPWPGEQGMRLLPLAFAVGSVVAAYLLARGVGWPSARAARTVGMLTAAAVMLSPWTLMRQELKQYTADACVALVLLWLAVRAERGDGWRPMATLAVAGAVFSVLSWPSMFVSASVFGALFVVAVARRDRAGMKRSAVAGALVAGVLVVVYLTLIAPQLLDPLADFWEDFYLEGGPYGVLDDMWYRYRQLTAPYPQPIPPLAIGAFVVGALEMGKRVPATALAVPFLIMVMVALGLLRRYPFLDQRTSHFLLIVGVAVAGIGLGSLVVRVGERGAPWGVVAGVGLAAVLAWVAFPHLREPAILYLEDVRSQVRHVQANRAPGDVVLVNHTGHFGLAYYWEGGELEFVHPGDTQFQVRVLGQGPMLMTFGDPFRTLEEAINLARRGTGRLWIVRSHVVPPEPDAWVSAFDQLGVDPEVIEVGVEPLLVLDVATG
jgi:hypothetical protein